MIFEVEWDHLDAIALRESLRCEIAEAYGRNGSEPVGSEALGTDMAVFLVAYRDGAAVACGGLRLLGERAAEIKRMYAARSVRGTGVATEVLRALETWAIDHDVDVLRLETGDLLHVARRFYEREGYVSVLPFGPYVGSVLSRCYQRRLRGDGVLVPKLNGMAGEQARQVLRRAGLVAVGPDRGHPALAVLDWHEGVVIAQRPTAGAEVRRGTAIHLVIAPAPGPAGGRAPRRVGPTPLAPSGRATKQPDETIG